jgi:biotin-(acetyl-CoA carboxylase) ligase
VLVEREDGLSLLGVGINVLQRAEDWPKELSGRVTSVRELGGACGRIEMAEGVVSEMDRALRMDQGELAAEWTRHDVLVGQTCGFLHDGSIYRGRVEAIEPTSHVRLRTESGEVAHLPALTTSMLHE